MNRDDLKNYKYNQIWIKRQLERYQEQKTIVYSISQNLDGMPKAKNKPNYGLENLMDQYDKILKILEKDQEQQNEIILQIRRLEEPYKTILTDKYILGMSLEEISVEIGYAYENVCRMHGTALNKFDDLEGRQ
jgi:hypothetical protein